MPTGFSTLALGGEDGGRVVGEGRPAQIAATPGSYTGQFLARYYATKNGKLEAIEIDDPEESAAVVAGVALALSPNGNHPERNGARLNGSEDASVSGAQAKRASKKKAPEKHTGPRKKKTGIP